MDIDYESEGQETNSSFILYQKDTSPRIIPFTYLMQKESISLIGISYKTYLFLLRLAKKGSSVTSHNFDALFALVFKIFNTLLLSDIEIVLWDIYLDRFGWQDSYRILQDSLLFSAYASKYMLNDAANEVIENLKGESSWDLEEYYK